MICSRTVPSIPQIRGQPMLTPCWRQVSVARVAIEYCLVLGGHGRWERKAAEALGKHAPAPRSCEHANIGWISASFPPIHFSQHWCIAASRTRAAEPGRGVCRPDNLQPTDAAPPAAAKAAASQTGAPKKHECPKGFLYPWVSFHRTSLPAFAKISVCRRGH